MRTALLVVDDNGRGTSTRRIRSSWRQDLCVEVEHAVTVGEERDAAAVGGPGGKRVAERVLGEVERIGAVGRGDVDLELAVAVGDESEPRAVGGVGRVIVESGAGRQSDQASAVRTERPRAPGLPSGRWRRRSSCRRATSKGGRRGRDSGSAGPGRCRRRWRCRSPGCPRGSS